MSFATSPGGPTLRYTDHGGAGRPAVLLQAMGVSSRCWFDLPKRLAARESPYRVVTMDNRGSGQSDKPMGLYWMRELADDVRRVMDAAGLDKSYVAGLSLGGMIAQELALQCPDRVLGLSLLRLIFSHKDAARGEELLAGWEESIHEEPIDPIGFLGQVTAAIGHSTGSRLHTIRCPTVILAGEEDVLTPLQGSRYMADEIPGSVLHVLTETGHGIPMSDPRAMERGLDELVALAER